MTRTLNPDHVRYIKCGSGGAFWPEALAEGWVPVGFAQVPFELSLGNDPKTVREFLLEEGTSPRTATRYTTELLEFCHLPSGSIFVTFADRHLWWAEVTDEVIQLDPNAHGGASRARRTKAGWSRLDMSGVPLSVDSLPTRLTRTGNYRMTICRFRADEEAMLLNRLNGVIDTEIAAFEDEQIRLQNKLAHILRRLDWRDLEQLVDLIFARSGWQRVTVLGDQEQDIDLIAEEPVFGDRAWVQVKAQSNIATVKDYLRRFEADGSCQRFVFACPELRGDLAAVPLSDTDEIWDGAVLAAKAMNAGLTEWVFQRV